MKFKNIKIKWKIKVQKKNTPKIIRKIHPKIKNKRSKLKEKKELLDGKDKYRKLNY